MGAGEPAVGLFVPSRGRTRRFTNSSGVPDQLKVDAGRGRARRRITREWRPTLSNLIYAIVPETGARATVA